MVVVKGFGETTMMLMTNIEMQKKAFASLLDDSSLYYSLASRGDHSFY
jgi:hypothetical protein